MNNVPVNVCFLTSLNLSNQIVGRKIFIFDKVSTSSIVLAEGCAIILFPIIELILVVVIGVFLFNAIELQIKGETTLE